MLALPSPLSPSSPSPAQQEQLSLLTARFDGTVGGATAPAPTTPSSPTAQRANLSPVGAAESLLLLQSPAGPLAAATSNAPLVSPTPAATSPVSGLFMRRRRGLPNPTALSPLPVPVQSRAEGARGDGGESTGGAGVAGREPGGTHGGDASEHSAAAPALTRSSPLSQAPRSGSRSPCSSSSPPATASHLSHSAEGSAPADPAPGGGAAEPARGGLHHHFHGHHRHQHRGRCRERPSGSAPPSSDHTSGSPPDEATPAGRSHEEGLADDNRPNSGKAGSGTPPAGGTGRASAERDRCSGGGSSSGGMASAVPSAVVASGAGDEEDDDDDEEMARLAELDELLTGFLFPRAPARASAAAAAAASSSPGNDGTLPAAGAGGAASVHLDPLHLASEHQFTRFVSKPAWRRGIAYTLAICAPEFTSLRLFFCFPLSSASSSSLYSPILRGPRHLAAVLCSHAIALSRSFTAASSAASRAARPGHPTVAPPVARRPRPVH